MKDPQRSLWRVLPALLIIVLAAVVAFMLVD
jgi:hypothetical protein